MKLKPCVTAIGQILSPVPFPWYCPAFWFVYAELAQRAALERRARVQSG